MRFALALACALGGCDLVFPLHEPIGCVLDDAPISYWHLDETAGEPVARDSAGAIGDATYEGAVMLEVPGALGTAASFETDGHVLLGERFGFTGRAAFTVEAWILPGAAGAGFRHVLTKQKRQNPKRGWALLIDDQRVASLERYIDDNMGAASPREVVASGVYTHIVGTYDGAVLRLYLNGLEVGDGVADESDMPVATAPAIIGSASAMGIDSPFEGAIDEVAIYDRALEPAAIRRHAERGLTEACSEP